MALKNAANRSEAPIARLIYGEMAYFGIGMARNKAHAILYLESARNNGCAAIQMEIARVYSLEGPGSLPKVAECLEAAAADGDRSAKRMIRMAKARAALLAIFCFSKGVNQK
jgi:TPR repeat protein